MLLNRCNAAVDNSTTNKPAQIRQQGLFMGDKFLAGTTTTTDSRPIIGAGGSLKRPWDSDHLVQPRPRRYYFRAFSRTAACAVS